MDNIISIFVILFIVVIINSILSSPTVKGSIGEFLSNRQLRKLPSGVYKVLDNVLIVNNERSSQIDHIVVSTTGIFVIETKNYTGWIHGSEQSEYWTQTIYKNKQRFLNPIKQNRSHIQALKAYLDLYDDTLYIPIIVFAGDARFKNVDTETTVIHRHELFWTILNYDNEQKLSREAVQGIYNTLSRKTNVDASLVNKHTHAVQYKSNERLNKERANICPRCNNSLVIRRGPYGKFYGCTGYPNCRYSKPL